MPSIVKFAPCAAWAHSESWVKSQYWQKSLFFFFNYQNVQNVCVRQTQTNVKPCYFLQELWLIRPCCYFVFLRLGQLTCAELGRFSRCRSLPLWTPSVNVHLPKQLEKVTLAAGCQWRDILASRLPKLGQRTIFSLPAGGGPTETPRQGLIQSRRSKVLRFATWSSRPSVWSSVNPEGSRWLVIFSLLIFVTRQQLLPNTWLHDWCLQCVAAPTCLHQPRWGF